jgi:hypothetical protein
MLILLDLQGVEDGLKSKIMQIVGRTARNKRQKQVGAALQEIKPNLRRVKS